MQIGRAGGNLTHVTTARYAYWNWNSRHADCKQRMQMRMQMQMRMRMQMQMQCKCAHCQCQLPMNASRESSREENRIEWNGLHGTAEDYTREQNVECTASRRPITITITTCYRHKPLLVEQCGTRLSVQCRSVVYTVGTGDSAAQRCCTL